MPKTAAKTAAPKPTAKATPRTTASKPKPAAQEPGVTDGETLRPTKKQKELLTFIEEFIAEHGYSPSYREIMKSCHYTSVATVALHVNSLIKRGHLQKREHAARSLEVVEGAKSQSLATNQIKPGDEKWLVEKVDYYFKQIEQTKTANPSDIDQLYVLVGALKVLGLDGAAQSFVPRLTLLKTRYTKTQ